MTDNGCKISELEETNDNDERNLAATGDGATLVVEIELNPEADGPAETNEEVVGDAASGELAPLAATDSDPLAIVEEKNVLVVFAMLYEVPRS